MFSRHDLVWLSPEGWKAVVAQAPAADVEAIELWRRKDWPAIVRRSDVGTAESATATAGTVSLGIALQPNGEGIKRRIAMRAQLAHVTRRIPALPLRDALCAAPAAWLPALDALNSDLPGLRVYGSLALQALTGLRYLTESSDIDLLASPLTTAELAAAIELLATHAAGLPLDGEIVFPDGGAVAWKEWRNATRDKARVLVKSIDAVRLADTASLLATLEAA
jgi:phosphoribosyl-dephospho-CoA transferase